MEVHEPPLVCQAHDPQGAGHRAPTGGQKRADQQDPGMPPRAMGEQRRERQDDTGEAGGQGQQGSILWWGRHQPNRHARFVTSNHRRTVRLAKVELRRANARLHRLVADLFATSRS
jgi:hypothetical protein